MRNLLKREMTYGMYSGGGVRCLRSYAFEGANHLLKTILFHKLTVLWNFRINYDLVVLGERERPTAPTQVKINERFGAA